MQITIDVPDNVDPQRIAEIKRAVETDSALVIYRPPAMTNQEAHDVMAAVIDALVKRYGRYRKGATLREKRPTSSVFERPKVAV